MKCLRPSAEESAHSALAAFPTSRRHGGAGGSEDRPVGGLLFALGLDLLLDGLLVGLVLSSESSEGQQDSEEADEEHGGHERCILLFVGLDQR